MPPPPDPFAAGAAIDPGEFTGRLGVVQKVCERLGQRESICVAGGPKTGRTSLLRYLASPPAAVRFPILAVSLNVFFSAEALGQTGQPAQFWAGVLRQLRAQLAAGPRGLAVDKAIGRARDNTLDVYDLEDVFDGLARDGTRVALFVDDFDTLLRNTNFWPPNDYFHIVRSLGQRPSRGLLFVIATSRALNELWDSSKGASPFYNLFMNLPIGRLEEADVRALAHRSFEVLGLAGDEAAANLVLALSGGHPFLTNYIARLCAELAQAGVPIEAGRLAEKFRDPGGPVLTLIKGIRERLTLTERNLVDAVSQSRQPLTDIQRGQLARLAEYALLPPGTRLR